MDVLPSMYPCDGFRHHHGDKYGPDYQSSVVQENCIGIIDSVGDSVNILELLPFLFVEPASGDYGHVFPRLESKNMPLRWR